MANSVRIQYRGEVLCCLDQCEVKAIEPYVFCKPPIRNVFQRIADWWYRFVTGKKCPVDACGHTEQGTKILFKDGTWIKIRMPFLEFVHGYC